MAAEHASDTGGRRDDPAPSGLGLVVEDMARHYGAVRALDGATLTAPAGEVHALLGENGAGKSTLIKILSGAERADRGTVTLDGRTLRLRTTGDAERAGIQTVFQELSLIRDMTVSENLLYGREPLTPLRTIRRSRVTAAAQEILERFGVATVSPDTQVRDLPVAQRQLVEIVKAAAREPRVLILDEATSALSSREQDWVLELAQRVAREGSVVLFISHRLNEIRRVAARMTVLRAGRTVGSGRVADVDDGEAVRLMLGRRVDRLFPPRSIRVSDEVVLDLRGVRLPGRRATIDLSLRRGEVLGVGGLQGQGQRELVGALAGALSFEGKVTLDGRPLEIRSPREALAAGVALVPEDRKGEGLLLELPIQDNISLSILDRLSHHGFLDRGAERRAVEGVAERLQITAGSWSRPAGRLSGGNQQKVVLAKLLVSEARILLLYDAARGVDVGTKAEIFALLHELAEEGASIVFYSTDLQELAHVCHRVVVMSDGALVGETSGEMTEEAILRLAVGAEGHEAEVVSR